MITLQHLQIIDKVTAEGSVTRASEKLYLTQSALSHQIRDLENALGLSLFLRSGKKLLLTEAGRKVLHSASLVLPAMQQLQEELKSMRDGKTSTIRLSTECYTCYHWLPPLLSKFNRQFPQIKIEIIAEATKQPMRFLEAGKLDVAVVSVAKPDKKLQYDKLFKDELVVLLPRKHPLAQKGKALNAGDFAGEVLIEYNTDRYDGHLSQDFFRDLKPARLLKIQLTEAIVEMVKSGMGISIMAGWAARQYLSNKSLTTVPLNTPLRNRNWYACSYKHSDEAVQQLVKMMQQLLKGAA